MAKTYKRRRAHKITFQEATRCIFCGDPERTWEHIFSRWTHRHLMKRSLTKKYHVFRAVPDIDHSKYALAKRAGDIKDWQVKCVCEKKCNNGWMREKIEDPARRIMVPLIKGEETRITPDQQRRIAAWAILKAMVAEFDDNAYVTTHHMHRKYLMNNFMPPPKGWVVWIGCYSRGDWLPYWISTPWRWLFKHEEFQVAKIPVTHFNSHISTQVVGKLFIHVISSPGRDFIKGWRFSTPNKGALFRIWPPTSISINWPPQVMTDRDADYAAGALYFFLLERGRMMFERATGAAKV